MRKHIIYLASGSARRFGSNKLLHLLEGKPMFLYGLEMLRQVTERCPNCDLTVVSRYEQIRQAAEKMGLRTVDCPESERGISYSIRAGIQALGAVPEEDYLLFVVADQPYLTVASVLRLLAVSAEAVEGASLCYGDRPGNPTLFSARLVPELLALQGDVGGRVVLRRHPCTFIQADAQRELEDVDQRNDV